MMAQALLTTSFKDNKGSQTNQVIYFQAHMIWSAYNDNDAF
jgi:hypothetical protein